ncbi:MAG: phenylalanine--tRNA ligase subunit beta [Ignavibacteriaceae bacterium]|nr:phenylalanine--tRNA ligase subunit beta [Ignavibacteriaceae bacterium]
MKVSLNWLADYIDLTGISVDEIVHRLTMSGLEVEDLINQREIYKDFVVGFVKEKKKHPNADKLSVCIVNDGLNDLQVVCGAPNVEAGQKVVFAPVGCTIPKGNFKLSKAKIRGVESFGMICAEDELELSDDHSGIMILNPELKEGTPVTEALSLNDVIIEVAITPNRPDALSHIGIARDLSALFNREMKVIFPQTKESKTAVTGFASVEILDQVNCPRYVAKVVRNVEIKDSPEWMKKRLINIGLRPINNLVDVTNYVMAEFGQPLHAFDLKLLAKNKIVVRSTTEKSKFTTLDSKERELPAGTLMICDGEKEVAIAGVMGGENSEIKADTKDILIESAYFNPSSIRRTSKSLMLSTESSYRFERGVDPSGTRTAAERAAQLIAEVSCGEILNGVIDVYPSKIESKLTKLRYSRITKILGYSVPENKIKQILSRLGFEIAEEKADELLIKIPTFRPDIEREIDLIEEIARIDGYDNIPAVPKISVSLDKKYDESEFSDKLRNIATGLGLYELVTNPLQSEKTSSLIGKRIQILNPQSFDMNNLRTSLIPGNLMVISQNIKYGEKDLALFEIGNVFNKKVENDIKSFEDFDEDSKMIISLTGRINKKSWNTPEKFYDFYLLKGIVDDFISKILLDNVSIDLYNSTENSVYEFQLTKSLNNRILGAGGKIKNNVLKQFDIEQDVFCFEFDLNVLRDIPSSQKKFKEPLRYPKVNRDFAFIFEKSISAKEITDFIQSEGNELLKSVKLFDLFESKSLGENNKSLAFALEFYSEERTLTEEEVEKEFNRLIELVCKKFKSTLRGK